jgi:hypothetical protein
VVGLKLLKMPKLPDTAVRVGMLIDVRTGLEEIDNLRDTVMRAGKLIEVSAALE